MTAPHSPPQPDAPGFWRSRYALGLLVMGAIATYFLASEHRAHFIGALPIMLLLACPLMHVFMHNGRGAHGGRHGANAPPAEPNPSKREHA